MALYPVQGLAYNPDADEVVGGATGGAVYATVEDADAGTGALTVYNDAGAPLAEVTANASGVFVFNYLDVLEGYVKFPDMPAIHAPSSAVPGLVADIVDIQAAADASAEAASASAADAAAARTAAELAADSLSNATASAVRTVDGGRDPIMTMFEDEQVPEGLADGTILIVKYRTAPVVA